MDEKDIWVEDIVIDDNTRFEFDKIWLKTNSDDTRERLRVVKYPDTEKHKVQFFYTKLKPQALVEWNDGTSEMSYEEVAQAAGVELLSDIYGYYFNDGGSEFKYINSIEDLYEI